jgi:hypothetical protein
MVLIVAISIPPNPFLSTNPTTLDLEDECSLRPKQQKVDLRPLFVLVLTAIERVIGSPTVTEFEFLELFVHSALSRARELEYSARHHLHREHITFLGKVVRRLAEMRSIPGAKVAPAGLACAKFEHPKVNRQPEFARSPVLSGANDGSRFRRIVIRRRE